MNLAKVFFTPGEGPAQGRKAHGILIVIALLFCLLLLAGCTQETPPDNSTSPPPAVLVDYTRTGGIAGMDDHMVVFSNGQTVFTTRQKTGEFTLPAEDLLSVENLIRQADFPHLNASYPAPSQGADYFYYTLTVGEKTVQTETTGIPANLAPLISRLEELLSSNVNK
ncbi:MAG: hypothetical protein LUQ01_04505 [Methanolinea sp.]|nr:hypothetical protein [Methanolinea sp.]